jgi:flagellar hook-associated protein 2
MTTSIFDINTTVDQIISTERTALDYQIKRNKDRQSEIDGLSKIKTSLSSFVRSLETLKLSSTFETKKNESSDSTVVSASSAVGSAEIQYDVEVLTLATPARIESGSTLGLQDGTQTKLTGGEVNTTPTQSLDPNASIQAGGLNLDAGKAITAGTFTINGVNIQVTASDTVNTILTKINNSSANITASYDETTDKITLKHNETGANYHITFGTDHTGFFNAMKLNGSQGETATQGIDHEQYRKLNTTSLSGITAGYFTINDRTFYVNPATDSLNDVLKRINSSSAGISVFYNEETDRITMTSKVDGQNITLKNDGTSGFLNAIYVADTAEDQNPVSGQSTYIPGESTVKINGTTMHTKGNKITISGTTLNFLSTGKSTVKVEPDNDKVVSAVNSMITSYNAAVDTLNQVKDDTTTSSSGSLIISRILTGMRNMLTQSISNNGSFNYLTDIGISYSRGVTGGKLQLNESKLRDNLTSDKESTVSLFSYDSDNNGLRDNGGIANLMKTFVYGYTRPTGYIGQRQNVISDSISRSTDQIQRSEDYFTKRRNILTTNLVRLQTTLQQMQDSYNNAVTYRTGTSK